MSDVVPDETEPITWSLPELQFELFHSFAVPSAETVIH
jgi:hypothetical protein